jgi:BirA family biotin operon repressor/biotin-[acetyl-CoA-carboxylase] ligase
VEAVCGNRVAAALIAALDRMAKEFPIEKEKWLTRYRAGCITTGKAVNVIRGPQSRPAFALEVEEDFSLRVRYEDGTVECVNAGEVSVRGMMGQM